MDNHLKDFNIIKQKKIKEKIKSTKDVVFNKFQSPSTKGLINVAATCYMNVTIQCLAYVNKLTNYLLNVKNINKIVSEKININ